MGDYFKFFIDQSTIKYLLNNLVLECFTCIWFLLFQEFNFEIILKLKHHNAGSDHLSHIDFEDLGG
jgi:hypothetical protein